MRGREGWRWGACLAPPRPVPLRRTFFDAGLALGAVTLALGAAALALGAANLALGLATVVFLPGAAAFALGAALALPAALALAAAAFLVAGTALPLAALTALALAGWWGEEGAGRDEGSREGSQRLRWASATALGPLSCSLIRSLTLTTAAAFLTAVFLVFLVAGLAEAPVPDVCGSNEGR